MKRPNPLFILVLALFFVNCSRFVDNKISLNPANIENHVTGPGFIFELSPNPRIQYAQLEIEGEQQGVVSIAGTESELSSEIRITAISCLLDYDNVFGGVEFSLKKLANSYMLAGFMLGGFEIDTPLETTAQKVDVILGSSSLFGYYFDYKRTRDKNYVERLVFLGDSKKKTNSCIKIRVIKTAPMIITERDLTGKALMEIQRTISNVKVK